MAEIRIEGQVITLADDIAADDAKLRATLVAVSPVAATCEIVRAREGDKLVVSLIKRAGTKGSAVDEIVDAFRRAPTRLQPVFGLIKRSSSAAIAAGEVPTDAEITTALQAADAEHTAVSSTVRRLIEASVTASNTVPPGF